MRRGLFEWICDEEGQDLVEYALLTAFIGLAGIAAFTLLANNVGAAYSASDVAEQMLWEPRPPG